MDGIELEDFGFREDMPVEVMNFDNEVSFYGQIDRMENGVLYISELSGGLVPQVMYGTEVKLRGFMRGDAVTVRGTVFGSTDRFWKVERLERLYAEDLRVSFRQHVNISAAAVYDAAAKPRDASGDPMPCWILDVSIGGMQFKSAFPYQVGDWVDINGAQLVAEESPFSFHCQVRWIRGCDQDGAFTYGCQMEDQDPAEQDRLCRAIFMVQRKERQRFSR